MGRREAAVRWFLPKSDDFLQLFDQASANTVRGATMFRELVGDPSDLPAKVERLKEIEHEGDRLTHVTLSKLNSSFITPFDREDIHALISRMDDILDAIDAASQRLVLYRVGVMPERLLAISDLIVKSTEQVRKAVAFLQDRRRHPEALAACVEINRIENEADALHREALADLFDNCAHDAILVIKLKEIYSLLEEATDRCEDVANAVESIIIKGS